MTRSQHAALASMVEAILKCDCAPADIRRRAHVLRIRLSLGSRLGSIFG